jgi:phosphatidylglycerophosphate synthase
VQEDPGTSPGTSPAPYYDGPFADAARKVLSWGVHPNHLTLLQLPVFALQMVAALEGWRWTFALLMLAIVVLDGGDGILARAGRLESRAGAILDALFDLVGIVVVLWGAARFFPDEAPWIIAILFGNLALFAQNALLEEKVIAYVRGPIVAAVALPQTLAVALVMTSLLLGFLLVARAPATFRALGRQIPL